MPSAIEVDQSRSGERIELELGGELIVRLRETPTTGFRWRVRSNGAPALSLEHEAAGAVGARPGAGRDVTFRFRAAERGGAEVVLAYGRAWSDEKKPASTFELRIVVT